MATKAAKSLTINATKFEFANTLAIDAQTGKLQLIAKDVVLSEVDIGDAGAVFVYNHVTDPDNGITVIDSFKDNEGNTITEAQAAVKVKNGAKVFVEIHSSLSIAGATYNRWFMLLDRYATDPNTSLEAFFGSEDAANKHVMLEIDYTTDSWLLYVRDTGNEFAGFKIDVDNNTVEVVEVSDGNAMQRTATATSQPVTITPAKFIERVNSYVGFESCVKRPNESIFTDSMKTWVATSSTGFTVSFYQLDGANGFAVYDTATDAWTIIYNP